jgi:hypothetical protein
MDSEQSYSQDAYVSPKAIKIADRRGECETCRDMLDSDDLALLERYMTAFHNALTRPPTAENLKEAVDILADASAPFGRLRWRLNQAVARVAVWGRTDA